MLVHKAYLLVGLLNNMKIGLVADEAFDLPQEIIEKYKIGVAKFKVDLQELKDLPGNIYQKTREAEKRRISSTVKTSQPSINDFLNVFKEKLNEFEEIFCVTISSKISGTYNSAVQAKKFLQKELQDKVHVIDSLNGSAGEGLVALEIIELIKDNLNSQEINNKIEESKTKLLGVYHDPKWLEASGRFPRFVPAIMQRVEKMSIKPIIGMKNGKLSVTGIKRNITDLSSALFEEFEKATRVARENGKKIVVGITHADDISQAEKLKEMVLSLKNTKVAFINLTCFPIGGHIGPNSLILAWQE
ncbi:MAG: fatty acid kinase fatty acid binding subunit [Patescibacteria group bacterium]|nr:fatty acid kinase fatty acid binding subunit [Patescibacteria group bacterium]